MAFFASHWTIKVRPVANSNRCRGPDECTVVTTVSVPAVYVVVTETLGGGGGGVGGSGAGILAAGTGFGWGFGFGLVVCAIAGIAMDTANASATAVEREQFIVRTSACRGNRACGESLGEQVSE